MISAKELIKANIVINVLPEEQSIFTDAFLLVNTGITNLNLMKACFIFILCRLAILNLSQWNKVFFNDWLSRVANRPIGYGFMS